MPMSKQLAMLAEKDMRICSYEYDPGNEFGEHWLHLHYPMLCDTDASIHERTVRECVEQLATIRSTRG